MADSVRPNLWPEAKRRLTWLERWSLWTVKASIDGKLTNRLLRLLQRSVGQAWIHHCTKNLRTIVGLEHVDMASQNSILVVANHRSFFDLYVITASLVRGGLRKRILFPVRSGFFYDNPLGLLVNFWMSFLSMYPPLFRERRKAPMNVLCLQELSWLLDQGGVFSGIHPEGTRNRGDDPYTLLPPRPGVGRLVHANDVTVIPAFVNGLTNDLWRQVKGNFDGTGDPIYVVFGEPVDLTDLRKLSGSPAVYRQIAERCMSEISACGDRERQLRAQSQLSA